MKKWMSFLLVTALAFSLTACSSDTENSSGTETVQEVPETQDTEQASVPEAAEAEQEEAASEAESEPEAEQSAGETSDTEETESTVENETSGTDMLVAYFSYAENAELPEGVDASSSASIQVWNGETTGNTGVLAAMIAEATGADLSSIQTTEKYPDTYDATIDQGQEEQSAGARPELSAHLENPEDYNVIFLGFPNWWGDMPMALYSFLEETDLSGKTIVPFVTSGGSGFSDAISTIESMEPDAEVQEGLSVPDSGVLDAQEQVNEWLGGLGYTG